MLLRKDPFSGFLHGLDAQLTMQKKNKIIILDGYNVIRRTPALNRHFRASPEAGRQALMRYCAERKARRKDVSEYYIVFDGDSSVEGVANQSVPSVRVIYSETGETADSRILSLIKEKFGPVEYIVVSDDNEVARNSSNLGTEVMPVSEFCKTTAQDRRARQRVPQDNRKATLSPMHEKEINESLKKAWGID